MKQESLSLTLVEAPARLDEAPPQRERLVEERLDLGARNVDAAFVALEAQDLVGIDLEGDVGKNAGRVGSGRCRHCSLRFRTTSFTDSPRGARRRAPAAAARLARPRSQTRLAARVAEPPRPPLGSHDLVHRLASRRASPSPRGRRSARTTSFIDSPRGARRRAPAAAARLARPRS